MSQRISSCFNSVRSLKTDAASPTSNVPYAYPAILPGDTYNVKLFAGLRRFGFGVVLQKAISASNPLAATSVISAIENGSPAERSGILHVGDRIVAVNCVTTEGRSLNVMKKFFDLCNLHFDVEEFVVLSTRKYVAKLPMQEIQLDFDETASSTSDVPSAYPAIGRVDTIEVTLSAGLRGFGFKVKNGISASNPLAAPPVISAIENGSPAERSGVLQVGDRILAVNGVTTEGRSLNVVKKDIDLCHLQIVLTIEFDVEEFVVPSSETYVVEIPMREIQLGFDVTASRSNEGVLIISNVKKGGVAYRTGMIQNGDELLSVDIIDIDHYDFFGEMFYSPDKIAKLRIHRRETFSGMAVTHDSRTNGSHCNSHKNNLCFVSGLSPYSTPLSNGAFSSSNMSLASTVNSASSTIGRVDTTEVTLSTSHRGFGFQLRETVSASDPLAAALVISVIKNGSSAEGSGVLQVGDRLLAVNGVTTDGLPINLVCSLLASCHPKVVLTIEFDVKEFVVPSSRKFVVNLTKNNVISCFNVRKGSRSNLHAVISNVKKGCKAHRCGMIQNGDKVLALDHFRIRSNIFSKDASENIVSHRSEIYRFSILRTLSSG